MMITFKNEEQKKEFVKSCRSFLNVKWKHRGRSRSGIDCGGLVICALKQIGLQPHDLEIYGREPFRDGLQKIAEINFGKSIYDDLKYADVLLLKFDNEPHHVAVVADYYLGGNSIIHACGNTGKVIETRLDEVWLNRVKFIYRIETEE